MLSSLGLNLLRLGVSDAGAELTEGSAPADEEVVETVTAGIGAEARTMSGVEVTETGVCGSVASKIGDNVEASEEVGMAVVVVTTRLAALVEEEVLVVSVAAMEEVGKSVPEVDGPPSST